MNSVVVWGLSSSLRNGEMNHFSGPRHFCFRNPYSPKFSHVPWKRSLGCRVSWRQPQVLHPHRVLTQSAGIIPALCFWSPEKRGESKYGWQDLRHHPPCVRPGPSHPWLSFWFPQQLPPGFSWRPLTICFLIVVGLQPLLFPFLAAFLLRPLQDLSPAHPTHTLSSTCSYLAQWLWISTLNNAASCSPLMFPDLFALLFPSYYFLSTSFLPSPSCSYTISFFTPLPFFPFSSFPLHPQSPH